MEGRREMKRKREKERERNAMNVYSKCLVRETEVNYWETLRATLYVKIEQRNILRKKKKKRNILR